MNTRQYYIDWIRLVAFFILIFFHTGMFFNTWGWHVKNNILVPQIEPYMLFFNQWRLSLLFFISGVGVSFALRSRTNRQFIAERARRLFLPFIFGMFVIVPPQIYFERLQNDQFSGSYLEFYPKVFEFSGYPVGNTSWHHLWFLLYLVTYCIIALPLFSWLRSDQGKRFLSRLSDISIKPAAILLYAIPLTLVFWFLARKFPVTHNFVWDWYNHAFSCIIFIYGYVLGSQMKTWEMLEINRRKYLVMAVATSTLFYGFFPLLSAFGLDYSNLAFMVYGLIKIVNIWLIILTICGFFKHYLNFSNKFIKYGTEAVLPFYILHQTITVSVGYYLINLSIPVLIKFVILVIATFGGAWIIYHFLIRPFNLTRFLFGLKPLNLETENNILWKPAILSLLTVVLLTFTFNLFISGKTLPKPTLAHKINKSPCIDGKLNDTIWNAALHFKDFKTLSPNPGLQASELTEIFLTYDSANIYVGVFCSEKEPGKIKTLDTPADALGKEDWVAFCLDTYSGDTAIYFFALNPAGKRSDGTLDFLEASPNNKRNLQWTSEVTRTDNGWSAEMAIPFKQFRIQDKNEFKMRFKVARYISKKEEEVDFPEIHPGSISHVAQFYKLIFRNI